uniref:Nicotinamide riboside kinase 2 n=1 Tax=Eptatretus burgeri TaxID=7764 RepID=A0A8C4QSH7_EPTBU
MTLVVGIGGVTNGGKTTLAQRLLSAFPRCRIIHQDTFFKPQEQVTIGEDGFCQYDDGCDGCHVGTPSCPKKKLQTNPSLPARVLNALDMDAMVNEIQRWMNTEDMERPRLLIVEGFLLYTYLPLVTVFDRRYFIQVPYEESKRRRSVIILLARGVMIPQIHMVTLMVTCGQCTNSIGDRWKRNKWMWCISMEPSQGKIYLTTSPKTSRNFL